MSMRWKKVLYEKHNVADNYVDPSFLSEMQKNVNLRKYSWSEAVLGACSVTQEICCTCLFAVTFTVLENGTIPLITVMSAVGLIILISSAVHCLTDTLSATSSHQQWKFVIKENARSIVVFLSFGYVFSPILKTLTETISTDTIHAMVTLMMVTHIVFQDYGADAAIVSSSLSLNSAIFAAVCLASRLPTSDLAFGLMILAIGFFVLLPVTRQKIQQNGCGHAVMTALLVVVTSLAVGSVFKIYAALFLLISVFINIICPTLFVHFQTYKQNIFGPWDEAIIKEK